MPFDPVLRESFDHIQLPVMYPAWVRFPSPRVGDLNEAIREALHAGGILDDIQPGMRIAIAVGSRGIARLPEMIRTVVEAIRAVGADPFIIPAMGSHGGATAEGQREVLESLGVTEAAVHAPIVSSMEVVELGHLSANVPVYMDRHAHEADGTILLNRIKPHTDFHGPIESGLAKMSVIGLGKQRMAETIHAYGPNGLRDLIPQAARVVIEQGHILGGIAIIENAYHDVADVAGVPPDGIGGVAEQALLTQARELMPSLPFDHLDVLVVDEMGKDVSGTGLDTNIIGRMLTPGVPEPAHPQINVIALLGLTEATHGNALGYGLADVITERCLNQIDWEATRVNALTAGIMNVWRGKLPWVARDDGAAVRLALRLCGRPDTENAQVMRIRNTLDIEQVWISEALVSIAQEMEHVIVREEPVAWDFDAAGRLKPLNAGTAIP
ncbi:MAG: DUF2088 domain-containing protein [Anaerolineae bacterium]|nr:DUF2088 domain-containing protein [Anaerolineae bacterium]